MSTARVPDSSFTDISANTSSNFYENTMEANNLSLSKRKSVISYQSTESGNEVC